MIKNNVTNIRTKICKGVLMRYVLDAIIICILTLLLLEVKDKENKNIRYKAFKDDSGLVCVYAYGESGVGVDCNWSALGSNKKQVKPPKPNTV